MLSNVKSKSITPNSSRKQSVQDDGKQRVSSKENITTPRDTKKNLNERSQLMKRTKLPTISNMITTSDIESETLQNLPDTNDFTRGPDPMQTSQQKDYSKITISSPSSPLTPTNVPFTISNKNKVTKTNVTKPRNVIHERRGSLDSLMKAAKKMEISAVDKENQNDVYKQKFIEIKRIKNMISDEVYNIEKEPSIKGSYVDINSKNGIFDEYIFDSLKKLQDLSVYLHSVTTEVINSHKQIKQPSTTTNEEISQTTLLPPLQLSEGINVKKNDNVKRVSNFKFPAEKVSKRGASNTEGYTPISNPASAEMIGYSTVTPKRRPSIHFSQTQTPKQPNKEPLQTPNVVIHSPTDKYHSFITQGLNKFGNSFTLFPKNETPVKDLYNEMTSPEGSQISKIDSSNTLVIPPLDYYQRALTITPKSSREENTIIETSTRTSTINPNTTKTNTTGTSSVAGEQIKFISTKSYKNPLIKQTKSPVTSGGGSSSTKVSGGKIKTLKMTNNVLEDKPSKKGLFQRREDKRSQLARERKEEHPEEDLQEEGEGRGEEEEVEEEIGEETTTINEQGNGEDLDTDGKKVCFHCKSSKTPEWRAGPYGKENICNACGLFYRKIIAKFGERGGNLLMKYRQIVCPKNRRVPAYIEIPEEYMVKFSEELGFS